MMRVIIVALLVSSCGPSMDQCLKLCADKGVRSWSNFECICEVRARICPSDTPLTPGTTP